MTPSVPRSLDRTTPRDPVVLPDIDGNGLACAALAVHGRSHVVAAVGLALAVIPFAVPTA